MLRHASSRLLSDLSGGPGGTNVLPICRKLKFAGWFLRRHLWRRRVVRRRVALGLAAAAVDRLPARQLGANFGVCVLEFFDQMLDVAIDIRAWNVASMFLAQ
jgi:hypothetical protein